MSKPAFDIRSSPTLRFAQRLACSGFALAVLEGEYRSGSCCWKKLERRLAYVAPKQSPAAQRSLLSAKAFRDAWRLNHRLQSRNVDAMAAYGRGPAFLKRLARAENLLGRDLDSNEFIPTLVAAMMALEWSRPAPKASARSEKRTRAVQVLERILERWKPNRAGWIDVPPMKIEGLEEATRQVLPNFGYGKPRIDELLRHATGSMEAGRFRVSPSVRASFADVDAYTTLDYLMRLIFDTQPMHEYLISRWAIDAAAATLATEAILLADANSTDFATFHRIRADSVLGASRFFLNPGVMDDWPLIVRFISLVRPRGCDLTQVSDECGIALLLSARAKFHALMRTWGVNLQWFHDVWALAHKAMPPRDFTRMGRPMDFSGQRSLRGAGLMDDIFDAPPEGTPSEKDDPSEGIIIDEVGKAMIVELARLAKAPPAKVEPILREFQLEVARFYQDAKTRFGLGQPGSMAQPLTPEFGEWFDYRQRESLAIVEMLRKRLDDNSVPQASASRNAEPAHAPIRPRSARRSGRPRRKRA